MAVSLRDRVRNWAARRLLGATKAQFVPSWLNASFFQPTFRAFVNEGYKANGVVFACVSELGLAFPEPELKVWTPGEDGIAKPVLKHPLYALLRNPMEQMSRSELLALTILYMAIGGNAYWYKLRSRSRVVGLVPLNDAQITPVAGGSKLVKHYEWQDEEAPDRLRIIPPRDIVHFKWMPDPLAPWQGLAPLTAVAREVDTDNEATRYLKALLQNDAIPRLMLYGPENGFLDTDRIRQQWYERYGAGNRGQVAVLEGGVRAERLSLDLNELAFEALRRVPEARICAAFRVPPIVVGVNVGIDQMTYDNVSGMRKHFTEDALSRLWKLTAETITTSLLCEFSGSEEQSLGFDLSTVYSLQENAVEKRRWANEALAGGGITRNEYRAMIGLPADPELGDVYLAGPGSQAASLPAEAEEQESAGAKQAAAPDPAQGARSRKGLPIPESVYVSGQNLFDGLDRWDQLMPGTAGLLEAHVKEEQG